MLGSADVPTWRDVPIRFVVIARAVAPYSRRLDGWRAWVMSGRASDPGCLQLAIRFTLADHLCPRARRALRALYRWEHRRLLRTGGESDGLGPNGWPLPLGLLPDDRFWMQMAEDLNPEDDDCDEWPTAEELAEARRGSIVYRARRLLRRFDARFRWKERSAESLCALLRRPELNLVATIYCAERAGFKVEEACALAARKNPDCTPASVAWLLSRIRIGDDAKIRGGIRPDELRAFVAGLVRQLTKMAFPGESGGLSPGGASTSSK